MRYGVFQFPTTSVRESKSKRSEMQYNVLHDDFGIHLIRDVDLGLF